MSSANPEICLSTDYIVRPVRGPSNPLELPEIVPVVASFLIQDKNALQACCRVSRFFHYVFTPVLWRDLIVSQGSRRQLASLEAVDKHAGFVRSLMFTGIVPPDYCILQFPNLQHLVIQHMPGVPLSYGLGNTTPSFGLKHAALVQNHIHLIQKLKVHCASLVSRSLLWEAAVKVKDLQHLDVRRIRFEGGQVEATTFYDLGRNAKVYSLKEITIETVAAPVLSISSCPSPWQDICFEEIHCHPPMFNCLVQRIVQSPELRSLVLHKFVNSASMADFSFGTLVREVVNRWPCWPHLVRIHLRDCGLDDSQLEALLSALDTCQIEDLNLAGTLFGPKAHVVLIINHSWTLKHLDLQGCKDVTSLMLHSILCSHSRLVSIKGGKLLATDLLEDERDWACNELQVWDLEIFMDERDPDHCCQVFLRLSSLTQLRTLILYRDGGTGSVGARSPLPLQADLGLELLQSLSELEELQFDQREVLEEDWDWILESFGRLRKIVTPKDMRRRQRWDFLQRLELSHKKITFSFI